jgi:transcriptional regulator with XRE-family HTH domain
MTSPAHQSPRTLAGHQGTPLRFAAGGHDIGGREGELRSPLRKERRPREATARLNLDHRPHSAEIALEKPTLPAQLPQVLVNCLWHGGNLNESQGVSTNKSQVNATVQWRRIYNMARGERIKLAMRKAGLNRTSLGKAVGVSQQAITYIIEREDGSAETLRKIADVLGVAFEWLSVGDNPPAWAVTHRLMENASTYGSARSIPLQGEVSAGGGEIDIWEAASGELVLGEHWGAVRVSGDSAYPAVFDRQFAIVDESRAAFMPIDEQHGWDLDDDLVLVRLHDDSRALLKRFCYHPPDRFVLASANSGRRSPIVEHTEIRCIVPVVAVVYYDPRERGVDRWKRKRDARTKSN